MDAASTDLRVPGQRSSDPAGSLIDDIVGSVVSIEATRIAFQAFRTDEILAADAREIGAPEEFHPWAEGVLGEMFPAALMESVDHRALYGLPL